MPACQNPSQFRADQSTTAAIRRYEQTHMPLDRRDVQFLDPHRVMVMGAIVFPISVVLLAIAQLFLRTFADTNQLGKTWIITTVASLLVVLLMTMVAPRVFPNQAYSLATAGLSLSCRPGSSCQPSVTRKPHGLLVMSAA